MEMHEVINRLKKQDKEALSCLYDNYAASLNGIIYRILPQEKLAEEVLQETFFKIWDKIDQYDESKSMFFTWISQIARNAAIDTKRKKVDKDVQKTKALNSDEQNNINIQSNTARIDRKTFIENLDEKHRIVIDYIYLKGYSQSQTAEALQIPLDTVKTRLRFAIVELRRLLNDDKNLFFEAISLTILVISCLCL